MAKTGIVELYEDSYGKFTDEWEQVVNASDNTSKVYHYIYYEALKDDVPFVLKVVELSNYTQHIELKDLFLKTPTETTLSKGDKILLADSCIRMNGTVISSTDKLIHSLDGTISTQTYDLDIWYKNDPKQEPWNSIGNTMSGYKRYYMDFEPVPRETPILTATNFTDTEDPVITYQVNDAKTITSLQAAISFDGETDLIKYRNISYSKTDGEYSYTFVLTDEERELLRKNSIEATSKPIFFLTKTIRSSVVSIGIAQRVFSVVGCHPILNPTLKDVNSTTIALTGNDKKFIRYESMAEFTTGAIASKHAEIVSQFVQCGSKVIYNAFNGVIDNPESDTFVFNVVDSRNQQTQSSVFTNMIPYVKPTCKQNVKIDIVTPGDIVANLALKITGNYYNGSFGAVDNTLKIEVRYSNDAGELGEWEELTNPIFDNEKNTYEVTKIYDGFRTDRAYKFQSRVTDKLNYVETAIYEATSTPVFDWGKEDFNFNVPVKINNETIIRHNAEANNVVLSASGGRIYLRPGGTDNTEGQSIFYPDGRVEFSGAVNFDSFTIGGNNLADYIIEQGSSAMGSNGTWYWCKWASGKAECWGCRNFGKMAVTQSWGSNSGLYRSDYLTQDLPEDVFITTPDVININIVNANYGGWICKHENLAPSAVTTGSFIFVRPGSAAQITPTYIGFHVIGLWKQ